MSGVQTVKYATLVSLLIQTVTGIVGTYGLTIPLKPTDAILKQVLGLEMIVQTIEFIFYVYFLSAFSLAALTKERYYDWFISTPMMLLSIAMYFYYVNFIEPAETADAVTLEDFVKENWKQITGFIVLNFLMLLFGFLGEIGLMDRVTAFWLGSAALVGSFGIIYDQYAKFSKKTQTIFAAMFGLWSMYGVAFLFPPVAKNLGYTALDIFAKNFFGLFLTYVIAQKKIM
jgi:hypothetical protein